MVVPRTSPRWVTGLMNSSARGVRAATRPQSWQQIQKRAYPASKGYSSYIASGDLPWAIGAAVVTIPSCAYLLQSRPKTDHDHGHNDSDHHEHEEGHEDEAKVEDGEGDDRDAEQSEGGSGGDTEEGGDADGTSNDDNKDSGSVEPTRPDDTVEDAGQGTPENPGDNYPKGGGHVVESGGNVEGVRFKGATGAGTKEGEGGRPEMGDTRKHIPDAKGGAKKRIESDYGKPQGKLWDGHDDDSNRRPSSSTPSDDSPAAKQEGISNTDTKHSWDMDHDPDKSKKGEGMVETAKVKGPVDPARPQAENRPGRKNATGSSADP